MLRNFKIFTFAGEIVGFAFWNPRGKSISRGFRLPCTDGVVVIAISLFPEVPGSIPERGKKRRFL